MKIEGNLKRALRKINHFEGRIYSAYLTPSEIKALLDDGYKLEGNPKYNEYTKEKIVRYINEGNSQSSWYYFTLGKHLPIDGK